MSISKASLRTQALAHRDTVASAERSARACDRLVAHIANIPTLEVIAGYMPIRSETDPRPAMSVLAGMGYDLCVPVVTAKAQPLRFRAWTPDSAMEKGAYGALIPTDGAWLEPELLITPLAAFDTTGGRLGYGGGYYDRTLAQLRARRRTYAVGLAFAAQECAAVPVEPTDQLLDAVITEADVIYPR